MASAQRNKDADATPQREEKRTDATPQREEKRTEMTAQREELQYKSIVTLQLLNGRRHTNKYVSVLMGLPPYSIHIQFFSQNQSLLSSIENQIFIKRVTEK